MTRPKQSYKIGSCFNNSSLATHLLNIMDLTFDKVMYETEYCLMCRFASYTQNS